MTTTTFRHKPNPAATRGSPFQGSMRLADMVYGVWALMPEQLLELQAIYEAHVRGDKIDVAAIEARLGHSLKNEQRGYDVVNGVGVLQLQGAISPKANLMSQISGGASAQLFTRAVDDAADDDSVEGLIIAADTPGGQVLGVPAAREAIRNFAAKKPVVTHTDGKLASAGIWIGGAANRVYMADAMCQIGSIGVVYTHTDTSAAEAKAGVKKTVITSGKYKRAEGPDGKLSEEGLQSLQDTADYVYSVFVSHIAEDYGVSADTVLEHMADGRVFIGQQAIDAGLVDGVSTLDALIEAMATNPAKFATRRKAVVGSARSSSSKGAGVARADATTTTEGDVMPTGDNQPITRALLESDHPALFASLRTEFTAAGAAAENARAKGVREQSIPGHETLIETLASDGKTTPGEAAIAINAAQRAVLAGASKAHHDDAPKAVKTGAAVDDKVKTKAQQAAEAKAYAAEHGISFIAAMKKLGFSD